MCRTYAEDTIDFRCSDSWRDYYFERGLTPFHSPGYRSCRDRLADTVDDIKTAIKEVISEAIREPRDTSRDTAGHVPPAGDRPKSAPSRYTRIP